jgi:hypothetical protein
MKTTTTITGREIKVSANQSKRTFTIRTDAGKYRTFPMSKQEFRSCEHNSGQDWQNFLRYQSGDYFKI